MMCRASCTSSDDDDDDDSGEESGPRPDLASSPEVLICNRTLRGLVRSGGSDLLSAVAVLVDVTVWTVWMLGIAGDGHQIMRPSYTSITHIPATLPCSTVRYL